MYTWNYTYCYSVLSSIHSPQTNNTETLCRTELCEPLFGVFVCRHETHSRRESIQSAFQMICFAHRERVVHVPVRHKSNILLSSTIFVGPTQFEACSPISTALLRDRSWILVWRLLQTFKKRFKGGRYCFFVFSETYGRFIKNPA